MPFWDSCDMFVPPLDWLFVLALTICFQAQVLSDNKNKDSLLECPLGKIGVVAEYPAVEIGVVL